VAINDALPLEAVRRDVIALLQSTKSLCDLRTPTTVLPDSLTITKLN